MNQREFSTILIWLYTSGGKLSAEHRVSTQMCRRTQEYFSLSGGGVGSTGGTESREGGGSRARPLRCRGAALEPPCVR